ncbi:unnamed protein product [Pylaiella littoralis]
MNTSTTATRSIKITFQGASRDVEVAADQATLAGLQAAIASAFEADLPPRSGDDEAPKDSDLRFTYKDPDGDSIVFDKDSELSLALRLCPSSLEISAAGKEKPANKHDREHRLYKVAARNLREYNGVPSMTPTKLTKTLAFLKLNPSRLVNQGLAPQVLLADMKGENAKSNENTAAATQQHPLGDDDCSEDLAESVAAGVEAMRVEDDDKKEWNDGFVSVEPAQSAAPAAASATAAAAAAPAGTTTSDADADADGTAATTGDDDGTDTDTDADEAAKGKRPVDRPVHKAFVAGGIKLLPREVWPLLVALGVGPRRLVKLGHVNAEHLRAMAVAHKRVNNKQQRMTRGSAGAAWSPWGPCGRMMQRGGGAGGGACGRRGAVAAGAGHRMGKMCGGRGKPCGRGMTLRLHPHAPACLPPPPPFHMEDEDGMSFAPAPPAGDGGGRRGGHRGGHGGPRSRPHHGHHAPHHHAPHPHPHGFGDGEGGSGFGRGPLLGMKGMLRALGRQQHQHQHGFYYWG